MAIFSYKLKSTEGKIEKGTTSASDYTEALLKVRKIGGLVMEITEVHDKKSEKAAKSPHNLPLKERIIFTEQLAVMLNAGITLVQALKGLEEESNNKNLRGLLVQIIADVESGIPFSTALAKHPKSFSNIYSEMVRSAEKTGNLADILNKLSTQQQKEYELRNKVRGALIYPAIVSTLLLGVVIMVITFILPKLTGLFKDSGVALPLSTRMLLALSDFMVNQWYICVGLVVGGVFGFKYYIATPKGRIIWDKVKIRIPVFGSFLRKTYMARFTASFASLAEAGVPVLEVFKTVRGVVGNAVYEMELDKISKDVENGIKVSVAIRKSKYFPSMIGQLVSVGEQSGDLAGIFKVLGEFFDKEVDTMAKNLSTVLEPVIMIVMGVVIGFVLISVLQPIYGLVNAV
jgi:type IV pilus assembly protein PilC